MLAAKFSGAILALSLLYVAPAALPQDSTRETANRRTSLADVILHLTLEKAVFMPILMLSAAVFWLTYAMLSLLHTQFSDQLLCETIAAAQDQE